MKHNKWILILAWIALFAVILIFLIIICRFSGLSSKETLKWSAVGVVVLAAPILLINTALRLSNSGNRFSKFVGAMLFVLFISSAPVVLIFSCISNDVSVGAALSEAVSHESGTQNQPSKVNSASQSSDVNKGYMTRQDDELLTSVSIKQGYGESLTKDEQDFLDKAKSGKLGKPYDNRPNKNQDGREP